MFPLQLLVITRASDSNNKLSINYRKSNYMIISNKTTNTCNFSVCINYKPIEKTDLVKYLGVYINDKLSWKRHISKLSKTLSKVCGIVYRLRYYVPLKGH